MRLIKSIVNENMSLIGFIIRGKAKEFGEMGDNTIIERSVDFRYMMKTGFTNSQVVFRNGHITERGNFKLNQLEMVQMVNGTFTGIPNKITLTSRYVMNNENIGFGVKFGNGKDATYKYDDIIKLSEFHCPDNFIVRENEAGKIFIVGKPGHSIAALPVVAIGSGQTAKRTKSGAKVATPVSATMINKIDIFDLFDFVNSCNGYIINFAGNKYKATGEYVEKAASNFNSLNVGEVAQPRLSFSEDKLNALCRFMNPGIISLSNSGDGPMFIGASNSIYTFIYRSKNLFYNGEHHLTKIGVIIPENNVEDLRNRFAASMAITEVTDENVISVVNRLIAWGNSKIFAVDVSKLALISPSKYDNYILDNSKLFSYVNDLSICKITSKYVRGAIKELGSVAGIYGAPKNRPIAPQFKNKTEEELENLILNGIDIYSGAFVEKGETVKTGSSTDPDTIINIRYIIDGIDPNNYNFKKITQQRDKCPKSVISVVEKMEGISDLENRLVELNKLQDALDKKENEIKRVLWLHKASMWLKANKLGVHKGDAGNWKLNDRKRTKATCYDCTAAGTDGLQVLLQNVDIAK